MWNILDIIEQNISGSADELSIWWRLGIIVAIIILAYLADTVITRLFIPGLRKLAAKTETEVDDILLSEKVTTSFSAIIPPIILTFALPYAFEGKMAIIIERLTMIYIVINVCRFIASLISVFHKVLVHKGNEKARSLKGLAQTFQVIVWFLGAIVMVSILLDKSPVFLLGGLGAFATVMMLVFQDSIKGLVAGVQLSVNDMVRPGDWIVMPNRNVDGVVTEISLTTVKVQNWDNTILTIQPYALITDTFQNWKGMSQSNGRRICRTFNVNVLSVRFCTAQELKDWKSKGYLSANAEISTATNLEAFRGYLYNHLRNNKEINTGMTFMVRQKKTDYEGIPIEMYCFSHTKEWEKYEEIQARLVEFAIASAPMFGICIFQRSSGTDKIILND